jgi:hypothetical protein
MLYVIDPVDVSSHTSATIARICQRCVASLKKEALLLAFLGHQRDREA